MKMRDCTDCPKRIPIGQKHGAQCKECRNRREREKAAEKRLKEKTMYTLEYFF